jgi:hypothetical protein
MILTIALAELRNAASVARRAFPFVRFAPFELIRGSLALNRN